MPLVSPNLAKDVLTAINHEITKLNVAHPLRKETMDGDVSVLEDNGVAVYHSAAGFYFQRIRTNFVETLYEDIRTYRKYLCSAFEMDLNDPSVEGKLLNRFQEFYGQKYSKMLDSHRMIHKGISVLLVKIPSCVLRLMMAPSGGIMKTIVTGSTESLKQLPTLVKMGNIQESKDRVSSVFVTEYKKDMYQTVNQIHYDLVREVLAKPNLGITVDPFAVWDP